MGRVTHTASLQQKNNQVNKVKNDFFSCELDHCVCAYHREQEEEVKSLEVHQGRDIDSLDGNDGTVFSLADIIQK